jgi:hypothetical protein
MKFEFVEGLSRPGDPAKPNDDAFCHAPSLAAVFDGATSLSEPLMPVDSEAAWIARRGAEGLIAHEGLGAREALRRAAADAERDYIALRSRPPIENYELPLASMMLAAPCGDGVEFCWFGDCAALVRRPGKSVEIIGEALAKRSAEARRVEKLANAGGLAPTAGIHRPDYLAALRTARNFVNTREDRWAFSPDANCANYVSSRVAPLVLQTDIILCTDGFLALTSDYGRYDADALVDAAVSRGLRPLFDELRTIERDDPDGRRFPRFKVSDDATALLIRAVEAA